MDRNWLLPEELYRSLHQWYTLVAFFMIGSLIGWGVAYITPSSYRATSNIYVGLNPYRAYTDTKFVALAKPKYSNIDDYKNWQMSQLTSVIYLDEFLQETLTQLRNNDDYWNTIEVSELRNILNTEWRTAGKWGLVAEGSNAYHIDQAAQTWSRVVVDRVEKAVLAAQNTFIIDEELQAVINDELQSQLRQQELITTMNSLQEWVEVAQDQPGNQPLPSLEKWQVLSLVTRMAHFSPAWKLLLDAQPSTDAPRSEYIIWIDQIISHLDGEMALLELRIESLQLKHERLSEQYSLESDRNLGLSPNIEIRDIDYIPPEPIRPTALWILIGGTFGILFWILTQLIRITREETRP